MSDRKGGVGDFGKTEKWGNYVRLGGSSAESVLDKWLMCEWKTNKADSFIWRCPFYVLLTGKREGE